jgi:hypothetical protein
LSTCSDAVPSQAAATPGGVHFFNPFPAELMTAYPVTRKMNKASFNEPEAIAPLERAIR